jgi:hypothetical protein
VRQPIRSLSHSQDSTRVLSSAEPEQLHFSVSDNEWAIFGFGAFALMGYLAVHHRTAGAVEAAPHSDGRLLGLFAWVALSCDGWLVKVVSPGRAFEALVIETMARRSLAMRRRWQIGIIGIGGAWLCGIACVNRHPPINESFRFGQLAPSEVHGVSSEHVANSGGSGAPGELGVALPADTRADRRSSGHGLQGELGVALPADTRAVFLHHSTGEVVWKGGVREWLVNYDASTGKRYSIEAQAFPDGKSYPWENYPYDYWNIWVAHAGPNAYSGQPTLEVLTRQYQLIVWKHCFPVSALEADLGSADIASPRKSLENYRIQYLALREKMREFPRTRFLVWTGAALTEGETNTQEAERARQFFDWVRSTWDERGDNIFLWDFLQLETGGGLFLAQDRAAGDSHPSAPFASRVAPLLARRIVNVIEGRGDTTSSSGE